MYNIIIWSGAVRMCAHIVILLIINNNWLFRYAVSGHVFCTYLVRFLSSSLPWMKPLFSVILQAKRFFFVRTLIYTDSWSISRNFIEITRIFKFAWIAYLYTYVPVFKCDNRSSPLFTSCLSPEWSWVLSTVHKYLFDMCYPVFTSIHSVQLTCIQLCCVVHHPQLYEPVPVFPCRRRRIHIWQ